METSDEINPAAEAADLRSAARAAWFETSMEKDRSLLTLSAGAIGLLLTLVTTTTKAHNPWLFGFSIGAFVLCIAAILRVFDKNRDYLLAVIQGTAPLKDEQLERLDRMAMASFGAGVVFFALLGIAAAQ